MRIIAGVHRGSRIYTGRGRAVRPTSDRVREALFSILGDEVAGARVLDLFAGSGALGFEALSRGAAFVRFIEKAPAVIEWIERNRRGLGIEDGEIVRGDVVSRLIRADDLDTFDLAFLDPPYRCGLIEPALAALMAGGFRGVAVIERDKRELLPAADGLPRWTRTRSYGDTVLDFLTIGSEKEAGNDSEPGLEEDES